jgi:hypothetical protein
MTLTSLWCAQLFDHCSGIMLLTGADIEYDPLLPACNESNPSKM